jgi:hypothetical protein
MTESPFSFELDGSVLGAGSAEELLLATAQADVLVALTEDGGAFPGRTVELAEISVAGEGERNFLFGDGGDRVSFRAGLAATARIVVTPDRETVLAGHASDFERIPFPSFKTIYGKEYVEVCIKVLITISL